MKEGFYSIQYRGVADSGFGVIVLDSGMIYGVDVGGVLYDGNYQYNQSTGLIEASLELTVPPGTHLVQGIPAQSTEYRMPFKTTLPKDLGSEFPVSVTTPAGSVNVIFKKIRDFPIC